MTTALVRNEDLLAHLNTEPKFRYECELWIASFCRSDKEQKEIRFKVAEELAIIVRWVFREEVAVGLPLPPQILVRVEGVIRIFYRACHQQACREPTECARDLNLMNNPRPQVKQAGETYKEFKDKDNQWRRLRHAENGFVNTVLAILKIEDNDAYSDDETAMQGIEGVLGDAPVTTAAPAAHSTFTAVASVNTGTTIADGVVEGFLNSSELGVNDNINSGLLNRSELEVDDNIDSSQDSHSSQEKILAGISGSENPKSTSKGSSLRKELDPFVKTTTGHVSIFQILRATSIFNNVMRQQRRQYSIQENQEATGKVFRLYICFSEALRFIKAGITRSSEPGIKNRYFPLSVDDYAYSYMLDNAF